jgi:ParB family chromosome partitioning protein
MRHDQHFVDELTRRHDEPIGRMAPLASIEPDPEQPRSTMGELDELAASIREKGVLEPILIRPVADAEDPKVHFRIISGERRYRAALAAGLFEIPVIEMEVDADEALEIALIENLQRKDLTPFEEAEGYRALAERHGYTHEQIAAALGRSRSLVTETLRLLDLPPRARGVAEALRLTSKSLLLEIARVARDEEELIRLLERAAGEGLTRDDVRQEKRSLQRGREAGRAKPFTFHFKAPDKTFNLSLKFRKTEVDRQDLITALEQILRQIREADDDAPGLF